MALTEQQKKWNADATARAARDKAENIKRNKVESKPVDTPPPNPGAGHSLFHDIFSGKTSLADPQSRAKFKEATGYEIDK